MSRVSKILQFQQSLRLEELKKKNSLILKMNLESNKELARMKKELASTSDSLKQILHNQIKETENLEKQKYHKDIAFKYSKVYQIFEKIEDVNLKYYLVHVYLDNIKSALMHTQNELVEITDKQYAEELYENFNSINTNRPHDYDKTVFKELEDRIIFNDSLKQDKLVIQKKRIRKIKYWKLIVGALLVYSSVLGAFKPSNYEFRVIIFMICIFLVGVYLLNTGYLSFGYNKKDKEEVRTLLNNTESKIQINDSESFYNKVIAEYPQISKLLESL